MIKLIYNFSAVANALADNQFFQPNSKGWVLKLIRVNSGQALITLLFFVLIGFTVISASAIMIFNNIQAASIREQGNYAFVTAQSGVDEALIRMIRDPNYTGTGGQPMNINGGSVIIDVNGGIITSTGTYSNSVRKIQAQTVYNENVLIITSRKEIN